MVGLFLDLLVESESTLVYNAALFGRLSETERGHWYKGTSTAAKSLHEPDPYIRQKGEYVSACGSRVACGLKLQGMTPAAPPRASHLTEEEWYRGLLLYFYSRIDHHRVTRICIV
jgi:hypothetical protein